MTALNSFYINGQWVAPSGQGTMPVIDPATEHHIGDVLLGNANDAEKAIAAARHAFASFSQTTREQRIAFLQKILECYAERYEQLALAVSLELGAPLTFARDAQVATGQIHLETTIEALKNYVFDEVRGDVLITREPIGVCSLITPWNWPLNQIVCKVAPALAAGCCMVLKPSEIAPLSSRIFAEVIDAAGLPDGVFNMVNGTGPEVGAVLASHPEVDMVSFTGSTAAGIAVAKGAADTVKRVTQELGGKSAYIVLPDADFLSVIPQAVDACFSNSGQSCDAPTRLLVPKGKYEHVASLIRDHVATIKVGDPNSQDTALGPVISRTQFDKIQSLIQSGIDEGAEVICGGVGRPSGLTRGYYVTPTVFGATTPSMRIVKEEIFGPVLVVQCYEDERQAIEMANDTVYGLAAYVQSADLAKARSVARQLKAGSIYVNSPEWNPHAPFGGYKQSGNGREYADWGMHDYLEVKGVSGWGANRKQTPFECSQDRH